MNSQAENEVNKCSLCGRPLLSTGSEEWSLPTGEVIAVPIAAVPYAIAEMSNGERYICENCYKNLDFGELDPAVSMEVHHEFAMVYRMLERYQESIDASHQALRFGKSPDILADIAYCYGEIGNIELAIEFYRQALAIDSDHFISRENLKLALERQMR